MIDATSQVRFFPVSLNLAIEVQHGWAGRG
jgi:hypothetical protein